MTGLGLVFYLRKQINSMSLHLDSLDMSLDDAGNAEKHISDMSMQRLNASFLEKLEEIRRARRELIIVRLSRLPPLTRADLQDRRSACA